MLGKIGKILEFLAGLSILIDIWGPERIRSFGKALRFWKARKLLRTGQTASGGAFWGRYSEPGSSTPSYPFSPQARQSTSTPYPA